MKNPLNRTSTMLSAAAFVFAGLSAAPALGQDLETVRFGLLPYQDWMPWALAEQEGFFADVGLTLEFTKFTDDITAAQAVESGDVDIASANSASGPLAMARFPDLQFVSLSNGFTGYAIMVRPDSVAPAGEIKTYEQLYEEQVQGGASEADASSAATEAACAQLEGRSIVMDRGTGSNLPLQTCLSIAGLTADDVEYIDISDVEGALAFWQGTGDFELGGYPQVVGLGDLGALKLVSANELQGTSVILSGEIATSEWADANADTIVKMRQVWYRTIDAIYDDPEMLQKLADVANEWQGTQLTSDDMQTIIDSIGYWPRAGEVDAYFFADDASVSMDDVFAASLDYWVNTKGEVDDGSVDLAARLRAAEFHDLYLQSQ